MPTTPSVDDELLQSARQVIVGINANPNLWRNPPIDLPVQTANADTFEAAMQDQVARKAAAEQATAVKNDNRAVVKSNLSRLKSWAESIVGKDDPRLNELGFSGPAEATPLEPPGQPGSLSACNQKPTGELTLEWEKAEDGGKPAGYQIQRKLPTEAAFSIVATATTRVTEKTLMNQPLDVLIQYRIVAFNDAGDSIPSNTVEVKL
jgi:hypothetical protein